MIKLINFIYYSKFKSFINILITFVLCSYDNFQQIELLKLTLDQQFNLNTMINDLIPEFTLTTYLIDPTNTNLCYLFIENTKTNEIKYYTMFLNNIQSLNSIKDKILHDDVSINNIFDLNFVKFSNIQYELENLRKSITIYDKTNYNIFIKRIINKIYILMLRIDSSFINNVTLNSIFYKYSTLKVCLICQLLLKFLKLGQKLKKTKHFNKYSPSDYLNKLRILDLYILSKISKSNNYISLDINCKFDYINKTSNCMYIFCFRQKISIEHLIEYILKKINIILNKLDKYTFVLLFLKIYVDEYNSHNRPRLLKLIFILSLYLHNPNIDLNNKETLFLLYMISKKRIFKNENYITRFNLCILDNRQENFMKIIIIRRLSYFFVFNHDDFSNVLTNLVSFSKYFNFIWIVVKSCVITIYCMFDIDLN